MITKALQGTQRFESRAGLIVNQVGCLLHVYKKDRSFHREILTKASRKSLLEGRKLHSSFRYGIEFRVFFLFCNRLLARLTGIKGFPCMDSCTDMEDYGFAPLGLPLPCTSSGFLREFFSSGRVPSTMGRGYCYYTSTRDSSFPCLQML